MSVKIRPYRNGGWEIDVTVRLPDGLPHRERRTTRVRSQSTARRAGEARERYLVTHGLTPTRKEVPTLEQFKDRFIENYCRANRNKPSGITSKESVFRVHLLPMLGAKPLDQIRNEDVARLKSQLAERAPATVNNVLSVLSVALREAVNWGVIEAMPCHISLLRVQNALPEFYDFDQYRWLVDEATNLDPRFRALVLLGGDAGLRRGEIVGLEQTDLDFRRDLLTVQRSVWRANVTATKGMEARVIPMTGRLRKALMAIRHLRGNRVLYTDAGEPATAKVVQKWMMRVQRKAGLKATGNLHVLRHSFCSHLAMRGVPTLAIQKLAGHKSLHTTMRYMHLSPGEAQRAIRQLEAESPLQRGDALETELDAAVST